MRTIATGDPIDGDLHHLSGVCALGGVEVLTVDGDRAGVVRQHTVRHAPGFEGHGAVFGLPGDLVVDDAAATVRLTSLGIDTEGDTELVLAAGNNQMLLMQRT